MCVPCLELEANPSVFRYKNLPPVRPLFPSNHYLLSFLRTCTCTRTRTRTCRLFQSLFIITPICRPVLLARPLPLSRPIGECSCMTVVHCTYGLGIGTPPMMTLSRWSLSRLSVVVVVPAAAAAVVAKAVAEAGARALVKSKGAYLAPFKILSHALMISAVKQLFPLETKRRRVRRKSRRPGTRTRRAMESLSGAMRRTSTMRRLTLWSKSS